MSHTPIASITLCLLVSGLLVSAQVRTPDGPDWSWLNDHRSDAFDKLLPVEHDGTYVAYRQYRDLYHDVPEQHFTIRVTDSARALAATVVRPAGPSIQQQLLDMHLVDRLASLDSLVSRIKLQRYQLTSTTCGALRPRFDALSTVAVSIPPTDTIVLHPFMHRIVLDLGGGRIDASLHEDEQPLVNWARITLDALSRCADGGR